MKKKILGIITAFVMVLSVVSFVPLKAESRALSGGVVAKIGDKNYATLEEAIAEANNNEIVMLESVFISNNLKVTGTKNFTLDLNGKKIIVGEYNSIVIEDDASMTVKDTSTNGTIEGYWPIYVRGNGTFTLESGMIHGQAYGITGNGSANLQGSKGTTINIKGGKVYQNDPNDEETAAIYHPQKGVINISGGEIEGSVGIELCSGALTTVNITSGVVKGTGTDMRENKNGDGCIGDGSAISAINRNYPSGAPYVTITGGTFISTKSKSILAYNFNGQASPKVSEWTEAKDHMKINGGTFSSDVSEYVTTGNKVYQQNGSYVVAPVATGVTLDKTDIRVEKGSTDTLTASVAPAGTLDTVTWSTSNDKVATVDSNGKVTAVKAGTVTITAKAGNASATCIVTVFEVEAPVIPTKPTTGDKTTVTVEKEAVAVLADSVKEVIENVETTTAISETTKEALKKALADNKPISVKPEVKALTEETVEKEVVAKIEEVLDAKEEVAQYFDLSMSLTADGNPIGTINELTGKVAFTITIDKDLIKTGRTFYMVRVHDGKAEKINGTLKDGEFTFETDKFSTYALVYDDTKVTDTTTPTETPKDTNKGVDTGDTTSTNALFALMGLAIVGMGSVVYRKRVSSK